MLFLVSGFSCLLLPRPFAEAGVTSMRGEEPVVTVKVTGVILAFTVSGLVKLFHDSGAG